MPTINHVKEKLPLWAFWFVLTWTREAIPNGGESLASRPASLEEIESCAVSISNICKTQTQHISHHAHWIFFFTLDFRNKTLNLLLSKNVLCSSLKNLFTLRRKKQFCAKTHPPRILQINLCRKRVVAGRWKGVLLRGFDENMNYLKKSKPWGGCVF